MILEIATLQDSTLPIQSPASCGSTQKWVPPVSQQALTAARFRAAFERRGAMPAPDTPGLRPPGQGGRARYGTDPDAATSAALNRIEDCHRRRAEPARADRTIG